MDGYEQHFRPVAGRLMTNLMAPFTKYELIQEHVDEDVMQPESHKPQPEAATYETAFRDPLTAVLPANGSRLI